MLECGADDSLKARVASVQADIDFAVEPNSTEACHRFGNSERIFKSRKAIIRFIN